MNLQKKNIDILEEDFEIVVRQFSKSDWKKLDKKSILITGASGFMGSYLSQFFCYLQNKFNLKIDLICLSRSKNKIEKQSWYKNKNKKSKIKIFIEDLNKLKIKKLPSFDICIYCASNASPVHYKTNPIETLKPNITGLINVLEQASKTVKFLYVSSGEVYGNQPNILLKEDNIGSLDQLDVRSCYGESKRMAENICISYFFQKKLDIRIVRPFHTYGPGLSKNDGRVFADFIHSAANKSPVKLTSDGNAMRPFCYISDYLSAIMTIHFKGKPGNAYNVANPYQEISIKKLAHLIHEIAGIPLAKVQFTKQKSIYLKSNIAKQDVSIEKLELLGWKPLINLYNGFTRSIAYERNKL